MKEQSKKTVAKKKFFKMVVQPCRDFCHIDSDTVTGILRNSILSERVCNLYIQCDERDGNRCSCIYH